jgi:hypothetical protein
MRWHREYGNVPVFFARILNSSFSENTWLRAR